MFEQRRTLRECFRRFVLLGAHLQFSHGPMPEPADVPWFGSDLFGRKRVLQRAVVQLRVLRNGAGVPLHRADLLSGEPVLQRLVVQRRCLRECSHVWSVRSELLFLQRVLQRVDLRRGRV